MKPANPPKKTGRKTSAKAKPPQPLASRTKASRRHPFGIDRCQRWAIRKGVFWQCPQAARPGVSVCPRHGAGFASREAAGERTNPVLPAALTGKNVDRARQILLAQHAELGPQYHAHLDAPMSELLDFRPQLAAAKTLCDAYLQQSKLEGDYGPFGSDPTILRALNAIAATLKAAERFLAIEAKLGPMTQLELAWMKHAYAATLAEFIPLEKLEAARLFCLQKLEEARVMGLGK